MWATCHTAGCGNENAPIDVQTTYIDEDGQEQQAGSVICGVCGNPIDDLSETQPEPQPEPSPDEP